MLKQSMVAGLLLSAFTLSAGAALADSACPGDDEDPKSFFCPGDDEDPQTFFCPGDEEDPQT